VTTTEPNDTPKAPAPAAPATSDLASIEARPDEVRAAGRLTAEIVEAWFASLAERPVMPSHDPEEVAALLDEPLPEGGRPAADVIGELGRLLPHAPAIPSPRYYGLLNPAPTPIAVFGEALAGALNQNLGSWRHAMLGVAIEERVLRWLCDLYGLPPSSSGTFTSGGTEANLSALACARHRGDPTIRDRGTSGTRLVGYVSTEGHFSLDRSFDLLGLGREHLRAVRSDDRCRIRVDDLRAEIRRDREAGRRPFVIVGVLGTTSSGAVDPLHDLGELAREEGLWFHVDAAYGGGAALSARLRPLCAGVELADSITVDPHKWFFVPFAAGAVLVRDRAALGRTFAQDPVYIRDLRVPGRNWFREGLQGSRRFNSLKLWLSLKRYGRCGYEEAVDRQVDLARRLHRRLVEENGFSAPHEPVLAISCFRPDPPSADEAAAGARAIAIQEAIEREGRHWISTTVVHGRRFLRANVNSYLTREEHVDELAERVLELATR
jgi:aromatic-L-amino-acid decarboxylase